MNIDKQLLNEACDYWKQGRALDAGQILFYGIGVSERPKWAISILRLVNEHQEYQSEVINELLGMEEKSAEWPQAKRIFSELRKDVLSLERSEPLDKKGRASLYQLYIAENVAKVVYNASNPFDEFDEDSGCWIVECLRQYADYLGDHDFTQRAWDRVGTLSKN